MTLIKKPNFGGKILRPEIVIDRNQEKKNIDSIVTSLKVIARKIRFRSN